MYAWESLFFVCWGVGKTRSGRLLFVAFTIRGDNIRVISACDDHKKEQQLYEK
ncbi:MAG: BrnT family toxin [Chloroflexi bacterium]|nr:BrnT family toxin [Chloroflexota bacterium]